MPMGRNDANASTRVDADLASPGGDLVVCEECGTQDCEIRGEGNTRMPCASYTPIPEGRRLFGAKLYNTAPRVCPLITIDGKPLCVMKDCHVRAIMRAQGEDCKTLPRDGREVIEEAPTDWEKRCDLLIETGRPKPKEWI